MWGRARWRNVCVSFYSRLEKQTWIKCGNWNNCLHLPHCVRHVCAMCDSCVSIAYCRCFLNSLLYTYRIIPPLFGVFLTHGKDEVETNKENELRIPTYWKLISINFSYIVYFENRFNCWNCDACVCVYVHMFAATDWHTHTYLSAYKVRSNAKHSAHHSCSIVSINARRWKMNGHQLVTKALLTEFHAVKIDTETQMEQTIFKNSNNNGQQWIFYCFLFFIIILNSSKFFIRRSIYCIWYRKV